MAQKQTPNGRRPGQGQAHATRAAGRDNVATMTAGTASVERGAPAGRRARQRAAAAEAARRRRLITILGAVTGVVVVAIIVIAVLLNTVFAQKANANALTNPNGLSSQNPPPGPLAVGTKAPDFNLATVDGKHYSLAGLHGHPALVEYFAVWCPHCQHMAGILNGVEANYTSAGLQSVAIMASPYGKDFETSGQTDTRLGDKSDIAWFKSTFNVSQPLLIDPNFATVNAYNAFSYPTIYILDRNGVIRYVSQGDATAQQLAAGVNAAEKGVNTNAGSASGASSPAH